MFVDDCCFNRTYTLSEKRMFIHSWTAKLLWSSHLSSSHLRLNSLINKMSQILTTKEIRQISSILKNDSVSVDTMLQIGDSFHVPPCVRSGLKKKKAYDGFHEVFTKWCSSHPEEATISEVTARLREMNLNRAAGMLLETD